MKITHTFEFNAGSEFQLQFYEDMMASWARSISSQMKQTHKLNNLTVTLKKPTLEATTLIHMNSVL